MDLDTHNRIWSERYRQWCRYCGGGWWGRGTVISPELRGHYETFLPFEEFRESLLSMASSVLPSSDWAPSVLKSQGILSLPDFWAMLPDGMGGQVCFDREGLFNVYCALADPPRYGTSKGRYPRQLEAICTFAASRGERLRLLDIGCGVGLGTYEMAGALEAMGCLEDAVGVTSEPLEVWMASHETLPHDPIRSRQYGDYPSSLPISFRCGMAEEVDDTVCYDVIVCNGLAGGRFLNDSHGLDRFLNCCRDLLSEGGMVFCANHFHDGSLPGVQLFQQRATAQGWTCSGLWNNLILHYV